MTKEFHDMTGRILHVGDTVGYIYAEYNKNRIVYGGTGKVISINEEKCRPIQVDFGEAKQSYEPHKLIILSTKGLKVKN